jgi:hypothetical protein
MSKFILIIYPTFFHITFCHFYHYIIYWVVTVLPNVPKGLGKI